MTKQLKLSKRTTKPTPVWKLNSENSYVRTQLYLAEFATQQKALAKAHNKYEAVLHRLVKLNRELGIHYELTDAVGSNADKFNALYNELYVLEKEINQISNTLSALGKATSHLDD